VPARPEELQLANFLEAGRAAWPGFDVDAQAFGRHLAHHERPALQHAADLYLAFACTLRLESALKAIDAIVQSAAAGAARRFDPSPAFADEIAQLVREKLFVADRPRIAEYAGRAALRTWLGMLALRAAQNARRRKGDRADARASLSSSSVPPQGETEREYLRARYREHFASAVEEALDALSDRERTLLRLHLGERLGIEALGEMFGVGKSTLSRWLIASREKLVNDVRVRLCRHLRITAAEYESLAVLVRSEVDVSVVRLLSAARK
jgi:RNA polymerase sigma-70 factor (ECF subfamily)